MYRNNQKGMKLKILGNLLIGSAALCFACQTPQSSYLTSKQVEKTENSDSLSISDMDSYFYGFNLFQAEPDERELGYPFKDVTMTFSANDKYSIQVMDPKLFTENNVEIVDLPMIDNYSMPMKGARVVSRYAGKRVNHAGIDLAGRSKDPIYATFDGIVRVSKRSDTYGNVIVVRHYNGLETVYSHNSKNMVKVGQEVQAGQQIAVSGRTGRASGDHLHFEVRINGQHFNPELVFNFETKQLKDKSLYCVKTGNKVKIGQVDPLPYMLAQHKLSLDSSNNGHENG